MTPPRELDEEHGMKDYTRSRENSSTIDKEVPTNFDPENVSDMATLLKARLQYARLKIATGMSTENLQQIERAFISSPRQPRRPLPSEYPPTPAHSSPHSRKLKRMLLSAMTPTQNSWRKKKRLREQKKNEAIEDEAAARTILMLSSSKTPPVLTPPRSGASGSGSSGRSSEGYGNRYFHPPAYYDHHDNAPSLYDAVAENPNYEEESRKIAKSLPRKQPRVVQAKDDSLSPPLPPPAVVYSRNHETGSPQQHYQYNRPLPPPPQYYYKPRPPPMFGRPLAEDPFQSKPIVQNQLSSSRHESPPSPFP
ncbi:unnamed protein product [Mucor hiemalis]